MSSPLPTPARLTAAHSLTATESLRAGLRSCQRAVAVALGFCLPLSTSISSGLIALYVALWLVLGDWRVLGAALRQNHVATAALAMLLLLVLGALHSAAPAADVWHALSKYRELLFMPLFLSVFADAAVRRLAVTAFLAGVGVMLTLSYIEFFTGMDIGLLSSTDQVIFKDRIIHCLLVAFFAYVLSHQAVAQATGRWWRLAVVVAALANMFVLVQGRTGQMIVTLLFVLFVFQHQGWKGCLTGAACALMFWSAAYLIAKPVQRRLHDSLAQIENQFGTEKKRSADGRLEFYELSLHIIREHPFVGVGTGGFPQAYRRLAQSRGAPATADPHNEYLLLGVQLGIVGPLAFLGLLGTQAWSARKLPAVERYLAQGAIVVIGAGCLVNSLLYGFTGGLFWGYFSALAFAVLSAGEVAKVSPKPLSSDLSCRVAA